MPTGIKAEFFHQKCCEIKKECYLCTSKRCPDGEMVDTLVSGASASRHVGSSPILGTRFSRRVTTKLLFVFFLCLCVSKLPPCHLKIRSLRLTRLECRLCFLLCGCGDKKKIDFQRYPRFTSLSLGGRVLFWATIFTFPPNLPLAKGGYKLLLINTIHPIAKNLALFFMPIGQQYLHSLQTSL